MKKSTKAMLGLLTTVCAISACAFFCACKKKETHSAGSHQHVYDDDSDTTCNVCGYVRQTETPTPAPPEGGEQEKPVEPTPPPEGYVIPADTDGLIIEGIGEEYALTTQSPAVDVSALPIKIYLSANDEKGAEVPAENYKVTVYSGNGEVNDAANLRESGRYFVETQLLGAVLPDGKKVPDGEVCGKAEFEIVNEVQNVILTEGTTRQFASRKDKISQSWKFAAVYANGDNSEIEREQATIKPLATEEAGEFFTTVTYCGFEAQISYSVLPVPRPVFLFTAEIIQPPETENGEYLLTTECFSLTVTSDANYTITPKITLIYQNNESPSFLLEARQAPYDITVKAVFYFIAENETFTQVKTHKTQVTVTLLPTAPPNTNLTVNGETFSSLPNAIVNTEVLAESDGGNITIAPQSGVSLSVFTPDSPVEIDGKIFDKAIEIENRAVDGKPFAGLSLRLNERAVVTVYAACPQDVFGAMLTFAASTTGEIVGEPTMITDGGIALTLQLEAGDYFCEFTDYKSYFYGAEVIFC